jgi:hypothetical protein
MFCVLETPFRSGFAVVFPFLLHVVVVLSGGLGVGAME